MSLPDLQHLEYHLLFNTNVLHLQKHLLKIKLQLFPVWPEENQEI